MIRYHAPFFDSFLLVEAFFYFNSVIPIDRKAKLCYCSNTIIQLGGVRWIGV